MTPQRKDVNHIFRDLERVFEENWVYEMGIDLPCVRVLRPTREQAFLIPGHIPNRSVLFNECIVDVPFKCCNRGLYTFCRSSGLLYRPILHRRKILWVFLFFLFLIWYVFPIRDFLELWEDLGLQTHVYNCIQEYDNSGVALLVHLLLISHLLVFFSIFSHVQLSAVSALQVYTIHILTV